MNLKSFASASLVLVVVQGCAAPSPSAPEIGVYDLASQRLTGAESVKVAGASGFPGVSILVTVDVEGKVRAAKVVDNWSGVDASAALAAARKWTFRPQTFDGRPIAAVGTISIQADPPEISPDMSVPFPAAALEDTEITLERSACFGSCPDYRVTVSGDGKIRFSTGQTNFPGTDAEVHRKFNGENVLWPGKHEAEVSPQAVAALVDKFRASHFMGMRPAYEASVTDNPTYALTLRVGKSSKRVVDYVGERVGMPASITFLEDAVDELAGTRRWTRGNAETVAMLKAQGFDFGSKDAAMLIQSAITLNSWSPNQAGAGELILAAIAEGLDLTIPVEVGGQGPSRGTASIGAMIARYAAEMGDERLFDEMSRKGQIARLSQKDLNAAFASGSGCSARIATALVKAGANPKAASSSDNALHALRRSFGPCADAGTQKLVELADLLVGLGVPLEQRDSLGWTPLMASNDPAVAQILLKAGANPNATDRDGTPVLSTVDDDRVVLTLLRAGAAPKVEKRDGSLRQLALKRHWPGTLAWLDAHNVK